MTARVKLEEVSKAFTLHLRGGMQLDVVQDVTFDVDEHECVVLGGPSGAGKSSLLKIIYGNYRCDAGRVLVRDGDAFTDIAEAEPRVVLSLRNRVMGYVSQFLRVIPRVGALDVVASAGRESGLHSDVAKERARELLAALNVPERMWNLPPATFSGGEQQRVNIARGFIADLPVLLLDEPTASLDAKNRAVVIDLIEQKKTQGTAIIGIFHDDDVRERVASRVIDITRFKATAAA